MLEFLTFLAVIVLMAVSSVRDRLQDETTPVERAKNAYAIGEIDDVELEQRLHYHLDDRNAEIQAVVEDVNGVGPDTGKAIAQHFASLGELREADRDDLQAVHGIGESTADAVLERVK